MALLIYNKGGNIGKHCHFCPNPVRCDKLKDMIINTYIYRFSPILNGIIIVSDQLRYFY